MNVEVRVVETKLRAAPRLGPTVVVVMIHIDMMTFVVVDLLVTILGTPLEVLHPQLHRHLHGILILDRGMEIGKETMLDGGVVHNMENKGANAVHQ